MALLIYTVCITRLNLSSNYLKGEAPNEECVKEREKVCDVANFMLA
jgi:hypothetical protein